MLSHIKAQGKEKNTRTADLFSACLTLITQQPLSQQSPSLPDRTAIQSYFWAQECFACYVTIGTYFCIWPFM